MRNGTVPRSRSVIFFCGWVLRELEKWGRRAFHLWRNICHFFCKERSTKKKLVDTWFKRTTNIAHVCVSTVLE